MARYIDVNNAIKAVKDLFDCPNGFSDTYDKACIIDLLQEVPTEDVEPVRYGKWLKWALDERGYAIYFGCSNCNCNISIGYAAKKID